MEPLDSEELRNQELREKRICRFCLAQTGPLSSIYDNREVGQKSPTPLPMQIMACVSIEVYEDDDMPRFICDDCRLLMDHSYRFKQICKKADTQLKTYPITGIWPEKLRLPDDLLKVRHKPSIVEASQTATDKPKTVYPGLTLKRIVVKAAKPKASSPDIVQSSSSEPATENTKTLRLSVEDLKALRDGKSNVPKQNPMQPSATSTPLHKIPKKVVHPAVAKTSASVASTGSNVAPEPQKLLSLSPSPPPPPSTSVTVAQESKPVILNNLSKPLPKVEEHFVTTSEGTLEMVVELQGDGEPQQNPILPVTSQVFPCAICDRTFPLQQLLDLHMQNHARERNFPCVVCEKRFFSKYDLAKHNLTHTGERPYVCVVCKAAFSRSTLLTRHQRTHKDEPRHICMYCERTFLSHGDLQKHIQHHEKSRPYRCKSCPKSFAYKQGMERHEVTHLTDLPFRCEYCDGSFLTAGKLSRHLTSHAGARPYPCRICPKAFLLSHHLTRHMRCHDATQATYKCGECDELFIGQDDLIYHSAVHATKTLICPLCKEHFDNLSQITDHIKQHSEGPQYACDYCDLLFTSEAKLDSHCQREHISELAMHRSEEDVLDSEQLVIEHIDIQKDGSQTITTFVGGKGKNEYHIKREDGPDDLLQNTFAETDAEFLYENENGQFTFRSDDIDYSEVEESEKAKTKSSPETKSTPQRSTTQKRLDQYLTKLSQNSMKGGSSVVEKKAVAKPARNVPSSRTLSDTMQSTRKTVPKDEALKPADTETRRNRPSTAQRTRDDVEQETSLPRGEPEKKSVDPRMLKLKRIAKPIGSDVKKEPAEAVATPPTTTTTKRSLENVKNPAGPPSKRLMVEKKSSPVANEDNVPGTTAEAVAKRVLAKRELETKGKAFDMKIGGKVVKVQRVVMSQSEVENMKREGKIEMQGKTMIIKQSSRSLKN